VSAPQVVGPEVVDLGDGELPYLLKRSERSTLAICVDPGGMVAVTAPEMAGMKEIEAVMRRRRQWIRRRLREVTVLPPAPPPYEWVSGETHRYLGRQYRLKVTSGKRSSVRLAGRFFEVVVRDLSRSDQVQVAMERWYLDHARSTFERRIADLIRDTPRLGVNLSAPLLVRRLRKRWGSCSAEGRILMNVDAVKLPVGCIDYLLIHELCHLRVPHHGSAFWRLLAACMPDWERWRSRLEEVEI
jgi:predicted metal-dependent hydrolase